MKDEMKKKKKLGMLSMPEKRAGEEMDMAEMDGMEEYSEDMDSGSEEMDMDLGLESSEEESMESEGSDLEAVSDEELMAELKKRGLSSQMGEEEAEEEDDQGMYV